MTLYINDSLIAEEPDRCVFVAYLEGHCDTLDVSLDDSEGAIRGMGIKKGDTVQAIEGNVDTGEMYISGIEYSGSQIAIRALSLPLSAFKATTKYWENATLTAIVNDVLKDSGLTVEFTERPNFSYKEMAMIEEEPLKFLFGKLELEGFGIRINDNTAYVFDEKILEKKGYELQLTEEDFQNPPVYSTKDSGLISVVKNAYMTADGKQIKTTEESGIDGKILNLNMPVNSVGESIRFSQGLMRKANKYEYVCEGEMENLERLPGEIVYLADAPDGHTGENVIYAVKNDMAGNSQTLYMRRPIEGGY